MTALKLDVDRGLKDFADLVSDWLWEIDHDNVIIFSNGRLEAAVRNPIKTFVGKNILSAIEEAASQVTSDAAQFLPKMREFLCQDKAFSLPHLTIDSTDALSSLIHIQGKPILDDNGLATGFRGVGRFADGAGRVDEDISQLKTFMIAMNNTPNGILITDANSIIRYVNPGFCNITGYSRAESLGKTPKILNSGHTKSSSYADLWNTLKQGKSWQGTVYNRRKNGELFWCQETVTPVVKRNGTITNFIAIQQDVTLEVTAQQKLRESQERFKGFTEAASDWYWETDAELRFSYISETACEYADMDLKDMLGMSRADLVTQSEDQEFWKDHLADLEARRSFKDFPYTFVRKDGQSRRWEVSGKPFYSEEQRFLGYRGVGKDVTVSTELEAQLQQSQKMEVVGHLTGGVAHDFNNLLGIIMGNAELLNEQLMDETGASNEKLNNIIYAAKRGSSITNQLLVFARKENLKPSIICLGDEIREMFDILKSSMGSGVELFFSEQQGIWKCYADKDQFVNSVLNLSINARDAMENQGRLWISLENVKFSDSRNSLNLVAGHYVLLKVKDEGCGIGREHIEKVFAPFFSTKAPGKGTGLGLSMVYGFVKKSNGAIWIDSEVGKGTQIYLYLPRHV